VFSVDHELITAPIFIGPDSWVAVDAYVHMGVTIGQGAVVGAKACVYKDVPPWTIVGGNPAKFIKTRYLRNA
jgi:putative colanic acid biosynthesis acetyltransferase WcaF